MPRYIRTVNRDSIEALATRMSEGALTEVTRQLEEGWPDAFYADMSCTGSFRSSLREPSEDYTSRFMPLMMTSQDMQIGETLTSGVHAVVVLMGRDGTMIFGRERSESSDEQTRTELSPALRRQLEEIISGISPKIRGRLSQFKGGLLGQEPIRESVMAEVTGFIVRLCAESDAVSVTFASDGTLSVAADFAGEVRLYAEVERNGAAEAAVIKERLYVAEIPGDTVDALTSEVILATVNSV